MPNRKKNRNLFNEKFGFQDLDNICIYTGRFTEQKNPLILAKAIEMLSEKHPHMKGLFVGTGEQEEEIKKCRNCFITEFMPSNELPLLYQNSFLGVWPREESMSMLDAISCGLPIIVSDNVKAIERVEGNGMMYKENNHQDLADKIMYLIDSPQIYKEMSRIGALKIKENYSWDSIALKRIKDYSDAL